MSHRVKISREFDLRKDSHSTNLEQRPQIFVKLSFTESCGSKLSGIHPFDDMTIIHGVNSRLKAERQAASSRDTNA